MGSFITGESCRSDDQNTFSIYWSFKLQNFIVNQINFNTFGGGLASERLLIRRILVLR